MLSSQKDFWGAPPRCAWGGGGSLASRASEKVWDVLAGGSASLCRGGVGLPGGAGKAPQHAVRTPNGFRVQRDGTHRSGSGAVKEVCGRPEDARDAFGFTGLACLRSRPPLGAGCC